MHLQLIENKFVKLHVSYFQNNLYIIYVMDFNQHLYLRGINTIEETREKLGKNGI